MIGMRLAAKVDIQRLGAKDPMRVVQQFTAAADRPTDLRFIVRLRKRAQIGDKRELPQPTQSSPSV